MSPDFKYQRDTNRFFCLGLDLNRPVDSIKQLQYARLKNVRTYQIGRLEPRPGMTLIGSVAGPVHSIRRLNTPRTSDWTRVIGSSGNLSVGKTSFTQIDTGYSGDPLALVPYRPPQSPDTWMYVMDSLRQRKVNVSGTLHLVGLPPPRTAPSTSKGASYSKFFCSIDPYHYFYPWSEFDSPSVAHTMPASYRMATTISNIYYDSGSTGWCTIEPVSPLNIGPGMDMMINVYAANSELVYVDSTYNTQASTIASISFISGTAGECSIMLSSAAEVRAGSILSNTTDGTKATVTSVTEGVSGVSSITCTTPAGSSWIAGDVIVVPFTFRCYCTKTHAAGSPLESTLRSTHMEYDPFPDSGYTGYITSATYSPAFDASTLATGIDTTDDDLLCASFAFSNVADISSMRLMIGCSAETDSAKWFNTDYFFYNFTPAELISSTGGVPKTTAMSSTMPGTDYASMYNIPLSLLQELLQSGQIDQTTYNNYVADLAASAIGNAYSYLRIRVGALTKVGEPQLNSVYHLRLEITLNPKTDANPTPECDVYIGSILITGGSGPDIGSGVTSGYIYRYRARCSSTGVVSNWGPPTRGAIDPSRSSINLVAPLQYTLATEADMLDFQRRGGALPDDWYYVGSVSNTATPTSLTDNYSDDIIVANPSESDVGGQKHYQLWPVLGSPVTGTTTSVSGTIVNTATGVGATPFSLTWAPQTQIEINGIFYTIYRVNSASQLELYENAGTQGAVTWRVQEPILQAQTLPCYWGPIAETLFGCGDPVNPQRLYWTNVGSADDTTLAKWIDVTSPSEPLMNGVIYNGRSYVWSSERLFQILPAGNDELGATISWTYTEVPNGKGLFAKWSFTGVQAPPGLILYWLAREGIYATDGGAPRSITDEDMRPLFPNEGNLGEEVNGIYPPNVIKSVAAQHRLSYIDDYLYYDYADTTYTPPEPLTFTGSDALFAATDSLVFAGPPLGVGLSEAMSTPFDQLGKMLTTSGAVGTDTMTMADSLGVTRTT